ncbi:glycosyltransferase 61 family protein [Sphingomonas sp. NBWT7]|uniref:glycosyltransferase 61 family protein n=1 Tax=Sphingomonas sp. NBWT7 TaxID=2596913 RepID=UPI001C63DF9A|nr:glycosyltransferase family 61 protein [Sphingomonas sp. NBWT7]
MRDARVQATARPPGQILGGPMLGDRPAGRLLRHNRRGVPVDVFAPTLVDPVRLSGTYAYLGISFGHFGHVMAETIHRIVPTRLIEPDPRWLIAAPRGSPSSFDALPGVCRTVLAQFGIDTSNCTVIGGDAIVEELLIVEAGSDLGDGPKDWYLDQLRDHGPARITHDAGYPEKIYVSRSALGQRSGILGERVLETALATAGFHVIHAQALPLAEQLAHYANAKVALFMEGSACHGVEMFGGGALAHTILLNRRNQARCPFTPVLASRSARFDAFAGNPYLGSVVRHSSGGLAPNRGVTVLAFHALADFLFACDVADIRHVSPLTYLVAAHHDLESYLTTAVAEGETAETADADAIRAALCARIAAGGTIMPLAVRGTRQDAPPIEEPRTVRRRL